MSHCPTEYLRHILDEIVYVETEVADTDLDSFLEDETLKRSFVRSLEIIGEAVKKLPDEFKANPADRLFGTAATVALCAAAGISIVRVHDVAEMADVVTVVNALRNKSA